MASKTALNAANLEALGAERLADLIRRAAGSEAEVVWVDAQAVVDAGIRPWSERVCGKSLLLTAAPCLALDEGGWTWRDAVTRRT